ncbi:MAG: uracil-DNA glycosylase [Beijerinckiaceae bacterium]
MISSYSGAVAALQQNSWSDLAFFTDGSAARLAQRLDQLAGAGQVILPAPADVFAALTMCPLPKVKVVILGQDPYPTAGDAHGLSFSVNTHRAIPRSLTNIFKELESDLGVARPQTGHLGDWAEQGVLLLNTCLTVEAGKAGSHRGMGWEVLTTQIIEAVSASETGKVFILWGSDAQAKRQLIKLHHCVLASAHPSPLSAYRGFFGSRPFSRTNDWLAASGQSRIEWSLS